MAGDDVITGNGATQLSYLNATAGVTVNFHIMGCGARCIGHRDGRRFRWHGHLYRRASRPRLRVSDTFHGSNNLTGVENFQGRGGDDLIDAVVASTVRAIGSAPTIT
jgi:hypothetical protein